MDIFKLANEIASNMSNDEKQSMDDMDMENMISHVTKNVFKMMNGLNNQGDEGTPLISNETPKLIKKGLKNDTNKLINLKTKDICFDLNVSLEDFYLGKKKKLNVRRKRIQEINGKQTVIEEKKKLVIPIKRGMKDGSQIKFEGEADHIPGYSPGDIIINLIENEHKYFQRDGDNLIIIKNINLYEIYDLTFNLKHLDSRIIKIIKEPLDALHLNDSLRKIPGQGMPIYKSNNKYGDLYIRFNIVIPSSLDSTKMDILKNIFNDLTESVCDSVNLEQASDKEYILEHINDSDISIDSDSDSDSESDSDSDSNNESELDAIAKELENISSDSD
jgi:DnaJ-class molecular chaperone